MKQFLFFLLDINWICVVEVFVFSYVFTIYFFFKKTYLFNICVLVFLCSWIVYLASGKFSIKYSNRNLSKKKLFFSLKITIWWGKLPKFGDKFRLMFAFISLTLSISTYLSILDKYYQFFNYSWFRWPFSLFVIRIFCFQNLQFACSPPQYFSSGAFTIFFLYEIEPHLWWFPMTSKVVVKKSTASIESGI